MKNITGNKYNRLTVKEFAYVKNTKRHYKCICDCGVIKYVSVGDLISGNTKSCGCLKIEITKKSKTTHGMTNTRLYRIWFTMKRRCYEPEFLHYNLYGGRGITVCKEWYEDFSNFMKWAFENGYSESLTLDRKNTNGNYEPFNCRWADWHTQQTNKRNNHILLFNGESLTMSDMAIKYNLPYGCLSSRIRKGWTTERALTQPKRLQ